MANRLLRLTVHDPGVIKALDALRQSRKQSAFVVEALRHYLGTVEGKEQLASFLTSDKRSRTQTEPGKTAQAKESSPQSAKPKANLDDIFNF